LFTDPVHFRPTELDLLIRNPTKAKEKLGWVPEHDLASLVKDIMQSDVRLMQKDQYLKKKDIKYIIKIKRVLFR
jgi:GDPmannose 4,6-dehydratase